MQNSKNFDLKVNGDYINMSNGDSGFGETHFNENSLLMTNKQEQLTLIDLNNRLSNYVNYVRQRDMSYVTVKSIEELSDIPSTHLASFKQLFESEIACLREALDKQSNELASLRISHDKLLADNNNISSELNDATHLVDQLSEKLSKSRSDNEVLRVKLALMEDSEKEATCLASQLKHCQDQLEMEVLLRTSAENACLTYKEKIEFNEAVFKKEFGALLMTHKNAVEKFTSFQNNVFGSDLYHQMEAAREKLKEYLDEYRCSIDADFLERIEEASNRIIISIDKYSYLLNDNGTTSNTNNELLIELAKLKASHAKLEEQLSDLNSLHQEKINKLYLTIADISLSQVDDFEEQVHSVQDLNDSFADMAQLDAEIIVYRKMLESEEERTNLGNYGETSPEIKRRKMTSNIGPHRACSTPKETKRKFLRATRQNKSCNVM